MVSPTRSEFQYARVEEGELDALLRGEDVSGMTTDDLHLSRPARASKIGVLLPRPGDPVRPLALVVSDPDIRHLCGRYAQLRTDLSPLTTWCHLLTPELFGRLNGVARVPNLAGYRRGVERLGGRGNGASRRDTAREHQNCGMFGVDHLFGGPNQGAVGRLAAGEDCGVL